MNSKQIRCFLEVSKCLNFTTASERLFLSQSTVSRQIQLLEDELGFELFNRVNNTLLITSAGKIMSDAFQRTEDYLALEIQKCHHINKGYDGHLKIGLLSNISLNSKLKDLIYNFSNRHAEISIDYVCYPNGHFVEAIESEKIDLMFIHDFSTPIIKNIQSRQLLKTQAQILYSDKHPLSKKADLSPIDFACERVWTTNEIDTDDRTAFVHKLCQFYDIEDFKTISAPNLDTALVNVQFGNGIMIMDSIFMPILPVSIKTLDLDPLVATVSMVALWKSDNVNPAIPLFLEFL